jgi:hypothetical protein
MIDLDDLAHYLHLGDLSADDAAILAVELGNSVVREYCGWYVYPVLAGDIITGDGDGTQLLKLPTMCVANINSITLDGTLLDVVADPTAYTWSVVGLVYRDAGWTCGQRNIVVDYDHGYAARPGGPALVALSIAAREYLNPGPRLIEAQSGTVRRRYADAGALSPLETRLLDPYRLP